MADKQYTNLDKEGLIFLLTMLNATLQGEFAKVKNDITNVAPQDNVTETGDKAVKSSGVYTFVNEGLNSLKGTIEGNAVNNIDNATTYEATK